MAETLSVATVQLNPCVGDIAGNLALALDGHAAAAEQGADIAVFSELFLIGYPPEDLVLKPAATADCAQALRAFAAATRGGPASLLGLPWLAGGKLYNAVALVRDGRVERIFCKRDLPNYAVFDEKRVFHAGPPARTFTLNGVTIGAPICEDIWSPQVCASLRRRGAEILLVPNGSPYRRSALESRIQTIRARISETGLPLVYVNQLGGQDELVFDGASMAFDRTGRQVQQSPAFAPDVSVSVWRRGPHGLECDSAAMAPLPDRCEQDYRAMVMGLGDYVVKNRFPGVVLGLSGGIDSALSAVIAVDALGPEKVWCVMLASRFTSDASLEDARAMAANLGCRYDEIGIEPAVQAFSGMLAPQFQGRAPDTAEENIQSRVRGVTLMGLSNKFGHMVLTTGNKSEMAVGYATLYGDMCGGYNALKDLYKTEVYAIARWRNEHRPAGLLGPAGAVTPERIITRAPSAELRADQTDQDSLPPYEVLDDILMGLVEGETSIDDIVRRGHDPRTVKRIEHLLYVAEYKRRQAPPGVKIGPKNFGRDRRYPITNRYRDAE